MTSKRLYMILCVAILLLCIFSVAAVLFGNTFIEKKSQEIVAHKAESLALEEQQRSLIQAKRDIENYSELELIAKSVVPQEKDQARAVREIIKLAAENKIPISNIIFPASDLGQATTRKPAAGQEQPTPSTTAAPPASQVKPVEGISGVFQMEINVQSTTQRPIPYENMLAFLAALEQNRRTAHITNLSVTPFSDNRNLVTFSLTINTYLRP